MKVIFCEDCGDIIAPYERARSPRLCVCKSHAVWWEDPARGIIRVAFVGGHPAIYEELKGRPPGRPRVWILGITNALLYHKGVGTPSADVVQELIEAHDDSYIFKRTRSLIIRVRPGQSGDSDWGYIPRDQMKKATQTREQEEAYISGYLASTAGEPFPTKTGLPDGG